MECIQGGKLRRTKDSKKYGRSVGSNLCSFIDMIEPAKGEKQAVGQESPECFPDDGGFRKRKVRLTGGGCEGRGSRAGAAEAVRC